MARCMKHCEDGGQDLKSRIYCLDSEMLMLKFLGWSFEDGMIGTDDGRDMNRIWISLMLEVGWVKP